MTNHSHASHAQPTGPAGPAVTASSADAHACDCAGHRLAQAHAAGGDGAVGHVGWLSSVAPILACALCPVCLSAYATILSALGVGVGVALSARQHALLVSAAVVLALGAALWRARVTQRYHTLALTGLGCALLLVGEYAGDNRLLIGLGMALLVGSMIVDRTLEYRAKAAARRAAASKN